MKLLLLLSIYQLGFVVGSPTDRTSSTLGHGRIVGGNEVSDIRQYPHQVALLTPDENNNLSLVCGGSILSATYVLTAAHCLVVVNVTHVRAGTIYYNDTTTEGQQTVTVSLTGVHPRYASNYDYDVGIVELADDPLTLNEFVVPVRLPLLGTTTWGIGTTVTVTGWGRTSQTVYDSVSPVLKEVHIPIVSAMECQLTFAGLFTERFVCVYGHNGNFCNGDSGGPIIAYGSGNFLVGVVSMASIDGCAMSSPQAIVDVGHIDIRSFIYTITKL